MDVLVTQHFIGDPVEDVEYEKAQRKDGSGYGVDPFGPVNETLVKNFAVVHSDWGQRGEHRGPFHSCPVFGLQAVTETITTEVKSTTLPHEFLLLWGQTQGEKKPFSISDFFLHIFNSFSMWILNISK